MLFSVAWERCSWRSPDDRHVFTRRSRGGPIAELCLRTISFGFLFYASGW